MNKNQCLPSRAMEHLDRGLITMKISKGIFMSWRFLREDPDDVHFNIYRDNIKIASISDRTNYTDIDGTTSSIYSVASVINGAESNPESPSVPMLMQNGDKNGGYFDIKLQNPGPQPSYMFRNPRGDLFNATGKYYYMPVDVSEAKRTVMNFEAGAITKEEYESAQAKFKAYVFSLGLDETGGAGPTLRELGYSEDGKVPYRTDSNGKLIYNMRSYTANDITVGDLDGDGQYEIIVKWDPEDSHDSMYSYKTSAPCFIDAYKMDGTPLWRINMGYNIRAGAHDTQMLVYDFNNDGKAEIILRTADGTTSGSLDADGNYKILDIVGVPESAEIKTYILNSDLKMLKKYSPKINNSQTVAWEDPIYDGKVKSSPESQRTEAGEWGEDGYISTGSYTSSGNTGNSSNQTWCKVFIYGPSNGAGNEYITAFSGDGRIIDSVEYEFAIKENMFGINPHCRRGAGSGAIAKHGEEFWLTHQFGNGYKMFGDTTANRAGRFLGAVALLDGKTPSAVIERGYYQRTTLAAYNLIDNKLIPDCTFDSSEYEDHAKYECRGNHNSCVGDVDGDGCDEIIYGSISFKKYNLSGNKLEPMYVVGANIPDTATPPESLVNLTEWIKLHTNEDGSAKDGARFTYNYHGDAIHLLPVDKSNRLVLFSPHEDQGDAVRGWAAGVSAHDAATGELIIWAAALDEQNRTQDIGRGVAANIDPRSPASAKAWAGGGYYDLSTGIKIAEVKGWSENFLIYWSGSLIRQTLDYVSKNDHTPEIKAMDNSGLWVTLYTADGTLTNNGTKGNPGLSADIFGDWREEIITRIGENGADKSPTTALRVSTTNIPTSYKIRTLMHDPMYRLAVAMQNVTYNQPPHTSFFLGYEDAAQTNPILP